MSSKKMLMIGAILAALAVTFGAFGAHYLYYIVKGAVLTPEDWKWRQETWEVGSRYLMYHALAVFACGLLAHIRPSRSLNIACWLLIVGVTIFSGLLFVLVLTKIKILGAIVPIGGLLMIFGWIALAYAGGGYCSAECPTHK